MRAALPLLAVLLLAAPAQAFDLPPVALQATPAYEGFDFPVSLAFAPDGRLFVTEKAGTIVIVDGGPRVWARVNASTDGEQGLLGLALHPDFATNGWVYAYYTDGENATNRVVRLADAPFGGTNLTVVLDGIPRASFHNGGVLAFGLDGMLYVATGDATVPANAKDLGTWAGKVLRVRDDGSVPADNPFPGSAVYTYGHRNVFGIAVDPLTGRVWVTENGPHRDDEVNALSAGEDYGWPDVTGYDDSGLSANPAFVFGFPLPALTQATFLPTGAYGAENRNALFFGGWNNGVVYRAILTEDRRGIVLVEAVHTFSGWGVLDVEVGPDGRLYVAASRGAGGTVFVLERLPPVGSTGGSHLVPIAIGVAVVATLLAVYLWRRRDLRRERS